MSTRKDESFLHISAALELSRFCPNRIRTAGGWRGHGWGHLKRMGR